MNQLPSDFVLEKRRCETLPARAAISFMIALLMVNTVGPAVYFTYVEQHQQEPLPQPYFIDSLALDRHTHRLCSSSPTSCGASTST
jgi:hypothetical protein